MRKVTKILLKALSVTLLFLIFCPIVLTLVADLPSVQNFLIDRATRIISRHINTEVSIGRIRIGALGSLRFDDFYVEDYQQDTLLYVGKLKIYLARFDDGRGLTLRNGSITNAYLNIRETPEGEMNIKQVVDNFTNKDKQKKSDFALRIADVRMENVNLVVEQHEHRDPSYGIDYNDMHIEHISAFIDNFILDGATIGGYIRNLSLVEHSGFMVQNFTGHFQVDKGVIDLRDFEVMAERSDLRLPSLTLRGEDWTSYKDFIHNVKIEGQIYRSTVSSSDVAHFAPQMLPWDVLVRDVTATVDGTVADLRVNVDNASFGTSSSLYGNVRLRGLPDVRRGVMTLDLKRLTTNEDDAARMLASITGRALPDKVLSMADAAGEIICAGVFDGGFSSFDANLKLTTQTGNATLRAERKPLPRVEGEPAHSSLVATADLHRMNLGRVLQIPALGEATAAFTFDGSTWSDGLRGRVSGLANEVVLNQTSYSDIEVSGLVINKSFSGSVKSAQAPFSFDVEGLADLNGVNPIYDFKVNVGQADLHAMNINKRDSVSRLGFRAELYAVGRSLDDMNGSLTIEDGLYHYNADTLRSGPIRLTARSAENRSLALTSDFVDANFTGPTKYAELMQYLKAALVKYMPGLGSASKFMASEDEGYSALSVKVKQIDPLLNAISEGLELARGSQINFVMNPAADHLMLRAESEYMERNKLLATKLNLNLTNQGDSLALFVSADDLYAGALHLPRLAVIGGARDDRILLSADFNGNNDTLSGMVALRAHLERVEPLQMPRFNISLYPATINAANRTWRITSDSISIDTSRIAIRDFRVTSGRESLHLNGAMSRSEQDSLTMYLRDFDIAPFMGFAKRMGYNVEGRSNGVASLKAAMSQTASLMADVGIDSMRVNGTDVAPLRIASRWDIEQQRVRVEMNNANTRENIVQGYYAPSSKRYYADATLKNLPMSMLDPLLVSVVSKTEGRADARLNIAGEGRYAKLNGEIDVSDISTVVDFTQARYSVPSAKVLVRDNHFLADDVRVNDTELNSATLTMDLSLDHLSNIAYDMRVVPRNMIVLNTTAQDNNLFYGKVYASGSATIRGDKSGTILDLTGTTQGNSQFFMPLSSKSDVALADFVVFEQPGVEIDSTNYLLRKKMAFERRSRSQASSSGSNMTVNIQLTATPTTEVQLVIDPTVGDIIRGRGNGTLNMRIVPSANVFDMYGDYTITEGSYLFTLQNIINKRFVINSGSTIQWTGDPLDARLDIDAVYKLRASLQPLLSSTTLDNVTRAVPVECIINLTERLTSPTVTFDIKVPNADSEIQNAVSNLLNNQQSIATQFMYLLVSGSFYSDSSTSSSIGATASATTGFELLSNQISNWLSSDDYNIVLRYRPRSELTSDEIDFGFSKSLVDNRLLVELEGNYLVDNRMAQSSNMSNFMGEAYITWLIDRAGNLKLRGFTQTIDRFDENQGLQETGLGIYYKEDFDNWADLKRRIRDRFMSKRRRAELEAAAEASEAAEQDSAGQEQNAAEVEEEGDEALQRGIERPDSTIVAKVDSMANRRDSVRIETVKSDEKDK